MRINKILFSLVLVFTLVNFISAVGCCFNPTNGQCTNRAEALSCTNPGMVFSSTSCESVAACAKVCCILGTGTQFVTQRECSLLSQQFGFTENYQTGLDETGCNLISQSSSTGACLFGDYVPFDCSIKTQAECASGQFHANTTCTNPSLNTTCNQTSGSMCYKENVYSQDSCGNPENLISTCNYADGTICEQTSITSAQCKSLNCDNGKKNGESWCVKPVEIMVGGRFFSQTCVNGQVITEPCADYRSEYCVDEPYIDIYGDPRSVPFTNGKCEINPVNNCMEANADLKSGSGDSEITMTGADMRAKLEDTCDSDFCQIFGPLDLAPAIKEKIKGLVGTEYYPAGALRTSTYTQDGLEEEAVASYEALGLELCFPKIQPGSELKTRTSPGATDDVCSQGDYTQEVVFNHGRKSCHLCNDEEHWGIDIEDPQNNEEMNIKLLKYVGMTTGFTHDWYDFEQIYACKPGNDYCNLVDKWPAPRTLPVNPDVVSLLNDRCKALGDCGGKVNYVGADGTTMSGTTGVMSLKSTSNGGWKRTYKFEYKCMPWKAPEGGDDCSKCGSDNLPCSEYRCKSLGKKCKYYEPSGIDQGACVSSDDKSSPVISLTNMNPPSPIRPYTPVEIKIATDELSECKFNINNAGAKYDEMKYDFADGFGTEHSVKLTLPGQIGSWSDTTTNYPLITQDGKYTMYVRCLDAAGNGQTMAAYPIDFEVMKTPDTIILPITQFIPESESLIKYNTTQKIVTLKMNEPMECKWSLTDKNFNLMENNFSCEGLESNSVNGYSCTGTLRNVTLELSQYTSYYIKCKDQPWIENESILINGVNYSRNINSQSYEYKLGPSEKLEIIEASPSGNVKISGVNATVELRALTEGGAFHGQSTCYWRTTNRSSINGTGYTVFANTNSYSHSQILDSPYLALGDNILQVKCNDSSGNEETKISNFNLQIDQETPLIKRMFYQSNSLKIFTDEESVCYYSFNKNNQCQYELTNGTMMAGTEKVHSAPWTYDQTYYIKCKDYFNNYNIGNCGGIIRTY